MWLAIVGIVKLQETSHTGAAKMLYGKDDTTIGKAVGKPRPISQASGSSQLSIEYKRQVEALTDGIAHSVVGPISDPRGSASSSPLTAPEPLVPLQSATPMHLPAREQVDPQAVDPVEPDAAKESQTDEEENPAGELSIDDALDAIAKEG